MAAVLELAALKVIPKADTQPGFSHRFTTKLAQAQGHGDLFKARFNIPVLTFSFTFTLKRRALVTLPGLGLTRGCSFFLLPFFFFAPFFFSLSSGSEGGDSKLGCSRMYTARLARPFI